MTENAYTPTESELSDISDRATWAVNSLLEAGEDTLAEDVAASYATELRAQPAAHLRKAG